MYVGGRLSWACCLLSLFFASVVGDRMAYLGCYVDHAYRNMKGDLKDFPTGLTPEVCMEYCKDRAFPFAGLQFSSQCFCGDKAPTLLDKRQESDCNMPCTGDRSQMCGGDWRNSVYLSGYKEALIVDSRYDYEGCYVDQDSRELSGHFQDLGENNSPERCITLCKEKGFKFAGLQHRTQCFCGNEEPRLEKRVDQQECKAKCSGDKRFNCGSDWRNNVYKTNRVQREQSAEITSKYKGCYVDEHSDRRLIGDFKDFGNYLTPQACIDYCKNKGQPFAGTQHSSLCFCGEVSPSPKDARPKGDCNAKCSGDQSQNCGGTWRNSIYETGFAAPSIAELPGTEYVGCYRDQNDPRLLRGHVQDFLDSLTPQQCVTICNRKNFKYAGLQASGQCWCGNENLPASAKVSDSDCSLKCTGDRSFFCGGIWRNSIYKARNSGSSAGYVGCYIDQAEPRLLREVLEYPETLTPSLCVGVCKKKSYVYAGLQNRQQCWCGDNEVKDVYKAKEEDCNLKCTGDSNANCGGIWRLNLYRTGNKAPSIAKIPGYEYVGCYVDQHEPRTLRGQVVDFPDTLTPQMCVALCKRKGFIYAGLQASAQCWCGDENLPAAAKVSDTECSGKCTGDRTFFCGGIWRNSIYKTGNIASSVANIGYRYMGCYRDVHYPRKLSGFRGEYPETLTPQQCVTVCKQQGFLFAGLQVGIECFCGNEFPSESDKMPESDCNSKCRGDLTALCGGTWRNTIYSTTESSSDVTGGFDYVGCYIDQVEPRLLRGEVLEYPETLTSSLCVGVCQKKGYVYAGLENRQQCWCGDDEVPNIYKANEEDCNLKCTGDSSAVCGGIWRLNLYRTGNKATTIAKLPNNEYVGCYIDQPERVLHGPVQDFPDTLTPQLCVALCKRKGFIYAGLQASAQCWCGDEHLPASFKVSDTECSGKCTGDRTFFCGGIWRNSIYKTGNSVSSVARIGYLYMGCYRDVHYPRKLSGFRGEYPETLTPQHCVTICKQKGFLFVGLQVGVQCYCGNEFPSESDKMPESDCTAKCSGDLTALCGGAWRNTIYSTAKSDDNSVENKCDISVTRVNGKVACQNEIVFEDNFDDLSTENWSHIVQIPNEPDYQFVIYKSDPANVYTANGNLVIKPTLLPDTEVKCGTLQLKNCTGNPDKNECGYKARSYAILPPVQSARLTTRKSFSFQYGKIEISAKLPAGDWLVPEIWLEAKDEKYGPGYASGKIRIAMSRGNKDLKDLEGKDIGCKQLESGVLVGVGDNIRGRTVLRETSDGWHNTFHNYSVVWTPENILFMIDGEQPYSLVPNGEQALPDILGFTSDVTPVWSSASKIAPFDSEFYITLGVAVGGVRNFPESITNSGKPKPWKNLELKALLNFWKDKSSWLPTWNDDRALLQVKYVKVTAL